VVFDLRTQYISREIDIRIIKRSGAFRSQIQDASRADASHSKTLQLIQVDVRRLQLTVVGLSPREIDDVAQHTSRCDKRIEMRAQRIAISPNIQCQRWDGFVEHCKIT